MIWLAAAGKLLKAIPWPFYALAALLVAGWFWTNKHLNAEADHGTVASVTRIVNGGEMGLAERIRWTETYRGAWVDFSNVESAVHSTERMQ